MAFELDAAGDMYYVSKVPMAGPMRIKAVDGAGMELSVLGTKMVYTMRWAGGGITPRITPSLAPSYLWISRP